MPKKTQYASIYPWSRGLDKTSIPGAQNASALTESDNIVFNNRGSLKKKPGVERIDYIGNESGNLQGAIHFFATSGGAQRSEIVRVIGGRVEAIRDGQVVDLGLKVSPTDTVTFATFGDTLMIYFENTRPKKYTIGASSLTNLTLLSEAHALSPPTFSRIHHFRNWYVRPEKPHRITVSNINDIEAYTLVGGGFELRVSDGDGDPTGINGLSPPFRGDLFSFKLSSIDRIYLTNFGYSVANLTTEAGCVQHNTIVALQNDVIFVSPYAIHSLASTDKHGAVVEDTISFPIFDYFQDIVNWSAAKNMVAVYDKMTNCYLLSFAVNDRVLGFNVKSRQFFEWDSVEYPVLAKYYDFGRQRTLIGDNEKGMGLLSSETNLDFGRSVSIKATTGILFPFGVPKAEVSFTKVWVYAKPTDVTTEFDLSYWVNGNLTDTITMDTLGGPDSYEGTAAGRIGSAIIGKDLIGKNKKDLVIIEAELKGVGNSIQFEFSHTPPENDLDQSLEIYGIVWEFESNEDTDVTVKI